MPDGPAPNADAPVYDWDVTTAGDRRGYIDPHALSELWFHTGTACNLACPFCLEGSKPGDTRLGLMTLADVRPFIDEALDIGVEQFSFTGGEPFVARDFVKILHYAADRRPCLVLTNATLPLIRRLHDIERLKRTRHPIQFRVSIDYLTADEHDAGRGQGSFAAALEGVKALRKLGFAVSVARQRKNGEDMHAVDAAYRDFFADLTGADTPTIVSFPDFKPPFSDGAVPEITEACMTTYHDEASRRDFMCAFSKMVVKQDGQMCVYACTLVDDDRQYDLGGTLRAAMERRVKLGHHRCYSCFAYGASCSERST